MINKFKLVSKFKPIKAQQKAINSLVKNFDKMKCQTHLGITGSGKTFVCANVIEKINKPTLILVHNKTLAAQLYEELKELFPNNRVEYFISYYDYFQPESYVISSDTYIEKSATVNENIERLRLRTMSSLLSRKDVIVVASISCIYGAGNPNDFKKISFKLKKNQKITRNEIVENLINNLYQRNQIELKSGKFKIIGDVIDIVPGFEDKKFYRIEMFGNEIEKILQVDLIDNSIKNEINEIEIYPAKQFVVPEEKHKKAIKKIKEELQKRIIELPLLESERIKKKVNYDLEMIEEMGYCNGIENYSRYFDGREEGVPPFTLLDYFPKNDFLLIIDESHQSIPQSHSMYKGDYSRKKNLIDFGFRLKSAFDNRPLKFCEFEKFFNHTIFVSATPSDYELKKSENKVENIIRPTGLLDPIITLKKEEGQIKDLETEIKKTIKNKNRILITTLTKRMAEDLCEYLAKQNFRVRYLHSEIESLERIEIIRNLRLGEFDILIGINLLREGLDIPEVELVAIMDADKLGFLRDERSLIQTIGRVARNENGRVLMYCSKITQAIKNAKSLTEKRREEQIKYNKKYKIIPTTIKKKISIGEIENLKNKSTKLNTKGLSKIDIKKMIINFESEMRLASRNLDFELAIDLRDKIKELKKEEI
jgi:excinuclease ABC subunit B